MNKYGKIEFISKATSFPEAIGLRFLMTALEVKIQHYKNRPLPTDTAPIIDSCLELIDLCKIEGIIDDDPVNISMIDRRIEIQIGNTKHITITI